MKFETRLVIQECRPDCTWGVKGIAFPRSANGGKRPADARNLLPGTTLPESHFAPRKAAEIMGFFRPLWHMEEMVNDRHEPQPAAPGN